MIEIAVIGSREISIGLERAVAVHIPRRLIREFVLDQIDKHGVEAPGLTVVQIELAILTAQLRDQRPGGVADQEERPSCGIDEKALADDRTQRKCHGRRGLARNGLPCPAVCCRHGSAAGLRARLCLRAEAGPESNKPGGARKDAGSEAEMEGPPAHQSSQSLAHHITRSYGLQRSPASRRLYVSDQETATSFVAPSGCEDWPNKRCITFCS